MTMTIRTTGMTRIVAAALLSVATPTSAGAQGDAARPDWWPDTEDRLATREQIEALSIEYYYRIDHGDAEGVVELFTENGVFHPGGSKPLVGRAAIRAYYAARPKNWVTRHVSTNVRLTYIDRDHVEAVRVFTHYIGDRTDGPGPYPAIPSVGEYREVVERGADGRWRYASRIATALFSRGR